MKYFLSDLGHGGRPLMNGISAGMKQAQRARLCFHHGRHSKKTTVPTPGSGLWPDTEIACTLISDLRTVRMTFLLFISLLDIQFLLEQSEQTETKLQPTSLCASRKVWRNAPNCIDSGYLLGMELDHEERKSFILYALHFKRERENSND